VLCLLLVTGDGFGQLTISGTVYDSTKTIPVKEVLVKSTNGTSTITDSLGHYDIVVKSNDSITFFYRNKATMKFAVSQVQNIGSFDISLRVRVDEKFRTMKEVRVYSRTYRQDSLENRHTYGKIFNYDKPGISTSSPSDYSGAAGMDLDEFINMFRFKRNRRLQSLQLRMIEQEQEKYIDYRFNKILVRRITRLQGPALDTFMKQYRPDFEFTQTSSTVDFYQYILNASYQFRREQLQKSATKNGGQ
jgi:hypothetical protein